MNYLQWLLSRLFIPLAWAMGVEWQDTEKVASLLGLKTFLNEFVAYTKLAEMKNANELSVSIIYIEEQLYVK